MDALIHGANYIIRVIYYGREFEATFMAECETLFGERFENVFLDKHGAMHKYEETIVWRFKK